jgi:hypothetical protein
MAGFDPRLHRLDALLAAVPALNLRAASACGLGAQKPYVGFKSDLHFMSSVLQGVVENLLRAWPGGNRWPPSLPLGHIAIAYAKLLGELPHTQAHCLPQGPCLPTGPPSNRRHHEFASGCFPLCGFTFSPRSEIRSQSVQAQTSGSSAWRRVATASLAVDGPRRVGWCHALAEGRPRTLRPVTGEGYGLGESFPSPALRRGGNQPGATRASRWLQ